MKSARAGAVHGAAAITRQRLPVAGKIRPGIKVLTRKAAEIREVKAAFDAGIEAGASYDDIERAFSTAIAGLDVPDFEQAPALPQSV